MIVNPSVRVRCDADGCAVAWLARRGGLRRHVLGHRAGAALLALLDGAAAEDLLDADALAWFIAHDLLISPPPPLPDPTPAPPVAAASPDVDAAPDPDFALVAEPGAAPQLLERTPWGAPWTVFKISPAQAAAYLAAHADPRGTTAHAAADVAALAACGALATPQAAARRRAARLRWLREARAAYARDERVLLDWPPPRELAALQAHARAVWDRGCLDGDHGVAGKQRSHVYDAPALRPLLARAAAHARAITGRPLVASYSFLSFYERGGGLPEHRDKSHCVVSMSVALHADVGWPLRVTDRDGARHELRWSTGQTLLFDGRRYAHARPPLAEPMAIHLVLHFQRDPESLP
ncbi:MAG: hypothetical protein JNL82_16295 [Myxococcales bacterium]|nr:hypothetical protein [Myxococcales bacterium]